MHSIGVRITTMTTERPNTVSGLTAKRKELAKYRSDLERELYKVTCDIDHLDAAIRLFDPNADIRKVKAYATKHRAKKGHMRRFVLETLKDSDAPMTSKAITEAWVAARGLRTDEVTYVILRKRVGASLIALRNQGLVETVGHADGFKTWRLASA